MKTVQECLEHLGVTVQDLSSCADLNYEFACIKKFYRKKVLTTHPDKGGDPAAFRTVQASFEVLREMFNKKRVNSYVSASSCAAETHGKTWSDFEEGMPTKSWEFYYEAAESDVPSYHMELAKSGRSACKQTGTAKKCSTQTPFIEKGSIRVGSINEKTGSYSRWSHLGCWRVPGKVWLGLPNPDICHEKEKFATALCSLNDVVLSGFEELPEEDQEVIIEFVMNKANWAKLIKRKAHAADDAISSEQAKSAVVVPGYQAPRQAFVIPVPGVNGARHNTLAGKAFVLTGIFPEVGGGTGLTLGKDRVKNMIEAFGGRVTGSISGKTDVLVVGKAPGFSKVSQARARLKMLLVNLKDLKEKGIEAGCFENAEHAFIASFSTGYKSNGLALKASEHDIAITAGFAPHRLAQGPAITKRKQSSLSAKDANPPAKKVTKAARKDSKHLLAVKTKKAPSKTKGNQEVFRIVCDGCGVDCTEKSWFVEENSTDWCNVCKEANGNENTLLQVNGITAT